MDGVILWNPDGFSEGRILMSVCKLLSPFFGGWIRTHVLYFDDGISRNVPLQTIEKHTEPKKNPRKFNYAVY